MRLWFWAAATAAAAVAVLAVEAPAAGAPQALSGRVVAVVDGDTLTLETMRGDEVTVRLDQIDAPETDQPWGAEAKRGLSDLVHARDVRVRTNGQDRYGRTLGTVSAGGVDVNAKLVEDGDAWAYRRYLRDETLLALEDSARRSGRGLWSLPPEEASPPWLWRTAEKRPQAPRSSPRPAVPSNRPAAPANCGPKRYCGEMDSCAEARWYLRCGLNRLDADGDGVPCETLCGSA
jgi:endonuclease YncB( thermonuclease family)